MSRSGATGAMLPVRRSVELPHVDLVEALAEQFLQALLAADRAAALQLASKAVEDGRTVADVHLHVIQSTLFRIGHLWETGRISVAAEHTATAIAQYVVTALYPMMVRSEAARGAAVVAGVAGESHQLGAHLVSDALEADGWQVRFLGADCSGARILEACASPCPGLLALSCTMVDNLKEVERVICALRQAAVSGPAPRILVGGQAFGRGVFAQRVAQQIGADAVAQDLSEAVRVARTWCDGPDQSGFSALCDSTGN